MRKIAFVLSFLLIAFSLFSCGEEKKPQENEEQQAIEIEEEEPLQKEGENLLRVGAENLSSAYLYASDKKSRDSVADWSEKKYLTGEFVALADKTAKLLGYDGAEIHLMNNESMQYALEADFIDIVIVETNGKETDLVEYTDPVVTSEYCLLVRTGKPIGSDLTVSAEGDKEIAETLKGAFSEENIFCEKDPQGALKLFSEEKVDAVAIEKSAADIYAEENEKDCYISQILSLDADVSTRYCIGYKKGNETLRKALESGLSEIFQNIENN